MPAGRHQWPQERIDKLKALCALNPRPSRREMAIKCGVTRYALQGKMHRLGLSEPANNIALMPKTKPYEPPVYGRKPTLPVLESLKDL